ncbi:MAG: hypothetical protein JWQ04_1564 [Pedosphaera sp.]|nr:hypothetical protein [Pedosphaera sp.]
MLAAFFGGWEILAIPAILFVVLLAVLSCVFWILMLVSAIQNKGLTDGEKTGWVLAIVFFHFIGSLLYLCIGYPKRNGPPPLSSSVTRA